MLTIVNGTRILDWQIRVKLTLSKVGTITALTRDFCHAYHCKRKSLYFLHRTRKYYHQSKVCHISGPEKHRQCNKTTHKYTNTQCLCKCLHTETRVLGNILCSCLENSSRVYHLYWTWTWHLPQSKLHRSSQYIFHLKWRSGKEHYLVIL